MKGILRCPFCGKKPSGNRFCSTNEGPALVCDHCLAMGPSALEKTWMGYAEDKLKPRAVRRWNSRPVTHTIAER